MGRFLVRLTASTEDAIEIFETQLRLLAAEHQIRLARHVHKLHVRQKSLRLFAVTLAGFTGGHEQETAILAGVGFAPDRWCVVSSTSCGDDGKNPTAFFARFVPQGRDRPRRV